MNTSDSLMDLGKSAGKLVSYTQFPDVLLYVNAVMVQLLG
jgi:hypothetical protein